MQKEVKLKIPAELWLRIKQIAEDSNRDVEELLIDSISSSYQAFPVNKDRDLMKQEIQAYEVMHPLLVKEYLGEYVAIFQGELVDHDPDPVSLHNRITAKYPNEVVLSRKVEQTASPVIHMRSPRLEKYL